MTRSALAVGMLLALVQLAVAVPNPASTYCISLGGRIEIRSDAAGEVGFCHLPDGRVVEEWALFRADRHGMQSPEAPPAQQQRP